MWSSLHPLNGEEGNFAYILTKKIDDNNFLLIGQIDSKKIYINPEHPILMYYFINSLDFFPKFLINLGIERIQALRLTNLISLIPLLILISMMLRNQKLVLLKIFSIILILLTPIFSTYFFNLQTDTLYGSVIFSSFGFLIIFSTRNLKPMFFVFFLAGFLISTGKQEWTLFFAVALILTFLIYCLIEKSFQIYQTIFVKRICLLVFGAVIGNGVSYFTDPVNYVGGINVFNRVIIDRQVNQSPGIDLYFDAFRYRFYFVSAIFVLIFLFFVFILTSASQRKSDSISQKILLLTFSLVSLSIPFLSIWNLDLRYFVPGFSLSLLTISWLILETRHNSVIFVFLAFMIPYVLVVNFDRFLHFDFRIFSESYEIQKVEDKNCINFISSAEAFYSTNDINWIARDLGETGAQFYLRNFDSGKKGLC